MLNENVIQINKIKKQKSWNLAIKQISQVYLALMKICQGQILNLFLKTAVAID